MRWRMCEVRRRALRTPTSYPLQGLLNRTPSRRHQGKLFSLILAKKSNPREQMVEDAEK
jgi:hypothetical protein